MSLQRGCSRQGSAVEETPMATAFLLPLATAAVVLVVVLAARATFLS
jgi:hypothetical protein